MGVEAVPIIGAGDRVPGPVRAFRIDEYDTRAGVFAVVIRPDVEIAPGSARLCAARALKPRMLVGGVVDDELGDDAYSPPVRGLHEPPEVGERAVVGMHVAVFADVITVIQPRRGIERQQPYGIDAEIGDVIELGDQAGKIADSVIVGIEKRFHVHLVDDRVLVPERIANERSGGASGSVHGYPPLAGAIRQIANGRSTGSSRMRCSLPLQAKRVSRARSSTRTEPLSGKPHSQSGTSMVASWALCGSRLIATRIMASRAGSDFP